MLPGARSGQRVSTGGRGQRGGGVSKAYSGGDRWRTLPTAKPNVAVGQVHEGGGGVAAAAAAGGRERNVTPVLGVRVQERLPRKICRALVNDLRLHRVFGPALRDFQRDARGGAHDLGLYPIVTSQYSSATLYQVPYHIQ